MQTPFVRIDMYVSLSKYFVCKYMNVPVLLKSQKNLICKIFGKHDIGIDIIFDLPFTF